MFPDEESARKWFESQVWPTGRCCPRCGSVRTHEASHAKSPYRCSDCRSYFSVKIGTALEGSKIPLRKWVFAIYLEVTSLKGVSSMKLHRDIKVTQKTSKQLNIPPVFREFISRESFSGISRLVNHQLHVREYLVHVLVARLLLHEIPEFLSGHTNVREKTVLLHVSPNQRSVEVVADCNIGFPGLRHKSRLYKGFRFARLSTSL